MFAHAHCGKTTQQWNKMETRGLKRMRTRFVEKANEMSRILRDMKAAESSRKELRKIITEVNSKADSCPLALVRLQALISEYEEVRTLHPDAHLCPCAPLTLTFLLRRRSHFART